MFTIILPLTLTILLPLISSFYWPLRIISLIIVSFISVSYLYQPLLSPLLFNAFLSLDQLSSSLITLTIWVSLLMIIARTKIFNLNNNPPIFTFNIILLALILVMSFSVSNFLNFYILFERSLLPTVLIILRWGYQPERLQAGLYLILYTIAASLPLLLTLILIIKTNGTLRMILTPFAKSIFLDPLQPLWWTISILAFLVKIPIFIFHLWLPKAHVEAPIAGSIILAGLLLKLGGYGLLRVTPLYPHLIFTLSPLTNRIALWGGVITRFICLRQRDIKSLIAYSSIGHISLVIIGTTLLSSWGWQGALAIIIAHGLCSSCLFALANITYETTNTRSIFLTKGLLCLFPSISLWWFILSAVNIAAPPSINLFAEISLFISAIWASPLYIIPLGICRFLAAAYSLFLYTSVNHGAPSQVFNPLIILTPSSYSLILFHTVPIFILILKPEIMRSWF